MTPELQDVIADLVVQTVRDTIQQRAAGHCLRVDELPAGLAAEACQRLQPLVSAPNIVRLVTIAPRRSWEVTPTQAVALRNEEEAEMGSGVLTVFVPPETRLSVEDSIGSSTFEMLRFRDLGTRARLTALGEAEKRNPQGAAVAADIVSELLKDSRYHCDDMLAAEYLIRVAQGADNVAAGLELSGVGLIPDRGLGNLSSTDEIRRRLQLNDQQMTSLEAATVPAERLRNLPIDRNDRESQRLIGSLQSVLQDGTSDRFEIGRRLRDVAEDVDYATWNLDSGGLNAKRFEITGLHGDFDSEGSEKTIRKADPSIGIRFVCDPAPAALPSAHALRLEVP